VFPEGWRRIPTRELDAWPRGRMRLGPASMGQTVAVIGIIIFAAIAVLVIVAFAAQISRRRRYERGEYDPDDV